MAQDFTPVPAKSSLHEVLLDMLKHQALHYYSSAIYCIQGVHCSLLGKCAHMGDHASNLPDYLRLLAGLPARHRVFQT